MTDQTESRTPRIGAANFIFALIFGIIGPCLFLQLDYTLASTGSGMWQSPVGFAKVSTAVVYGAAFSTMAMLLAFPVNISAFQSFRAGWLIFGAVASLWLGIALFTSFWQSSVTAPLLHSSITAVIVVGVSAPPVIAYYWSAHARYWGKRNPIWLTFGFLVPLACSTALEVFERLWLGPATHVLQSTQTTTEEAEIAISRLGKYPLRLGRHVGPICRYLLGAQSGTLANLSPAVLVAAKEAMGVPDPVRHCEQWDN